MNYAIKMLEDGLTIQKEEIKAGKSEIQHLSKSIEELQQGKDFMPSQFWEFVGAKSFEEKINYALKKIETYKKNQKEYEKNIQELEEAKKILLQASKTK